MSPVGSSALPAALAQPRSDRLPSTAFECAFQKIGAKPEEIIHVAMGWEYDIIPGHDLGFKRLVWINRRNQPGSPAYDYEELPDLSKLPELLGC